MCGICGERRLDGSPSAPGLIERMLAAVARRGPDGQGIHRGDSLVLGHRRLAVIDPSARAHQPMVDGDLVLVFNGTLYNFRELRGRLQALGHRFVSEGDSEVILKAYRAWGDRCVEHLHGEFAFAIWDGNAQRLLCARDRMGIKPFYYAADGRSFRFASNLDALLAAGGIDTRIDPVALHHQFTLHGVVPAPATVLRGVRKLPPAHCLVLERDGRHILRRYWQLDARREAVERDEQAWADAMHAALRDAVVSRHRVSDVPVGVLLSGGLDSSLLVALLAEAGVADLQTFAIGFADQPEEKGDEFEFSDLVAARYRTLHRRVVVPDDQLLVRLPQAVDAMAEPMFGHDAVAFFLLAERVAESLKVVQCGQGADEVFAGYAWYARMRDDRSGSRLTRFGRHYFDREQAEFLSMTTSAFDVGDPTAALVEARLDDALSETFIDAVLKLDVTTLVVDDPVKRIDNMTMAWGLEARVPFLDQRVVELAARCPPSLKLASGGKHLLKRIARGRVPDAVIDRPKGYFPVPAIKYLRGDLLDFVRSVLDSRACRERGLFERRYIDRLLAAPAMHHTRIMGNKLWQIALFEYWMQRHVDRCVAAA
ncbi:MAG: N-acetylglutaminylglutamine amidotransferase [Chromatiaceae bacterium]|nr:N-acetylglutaminylglutamine amidotransferase [Chromatiaceae bacterium]MCP5313999.1 N-acetylglutaminylglutamine amidotransferase [Chromatiaceae bacterium]